MAVVSISTTLGFYARTVHYKYTIFVCWQKFVSHTCNDDTSQYLPKNGPLFLYANCFKSIVLSKHLRIKALAKFASAHIHRCLSWRMKAILMLNV